MTEHRWSKFWWQDYEQDTALAVCSLEAQGLWMRLLCLMYRSTPRGHLAHPETGEPLDELALSRLLSTDWRTIKRLLPELERNGVFSRTEAGVIFSRRVVREQQVSEKAREYGSRGGNPALKKVNPHDNPPAGPNGPKRVNPRLKLQEAEAEAEAEERKTVASLRAARPPVPPPIPDRDWVWGEGLRIVRGFTGNGQSTARSFLGRLVKEAHDDCGRVRAALTRAEDERPIDAQAWLMGAVRRSPRDERADYLRDLIEGTEH